MDRIWKPFSALSTGSNYPPHHLLWSDIVSLRENDDPNVPGTIDKSQPAIKRAD